MPKPIQLREYVSESGRLALSIWLEGLPKQPKSDIRTKLAYLEDRDKWDQADIKALKGDGRGLYEIKVKSEKVQYRIIAFDGPGRNELTLLLGATKTSAGRKTHWKPVEAIHTAQSRKNDADLDRDKYSVEFEPWPQDRGNSGLRP